MFMTMSSVAGMSRRKNEPSLVLAEMEVKVTFVKRMSPEPRLASMRPMLALLAWRERVGGRRYADPSLIFVIDTSGLTMIFGETAGSSFGWSMMNVGGGVVSGTVIETRQSREQVPIGTDEQPEASMLKKVPPMTGPN